MRMSGFGPRTILVLTCSLIVSLLADSPLLARERKTIQKTSTDAQTRAGNSWIDQASTTANHGTDTQLQVVNQNNAARRALLTFDLSGMSNSGIKLATLTLFMTTAPNQNQTLQAFRLINMWDAPSVTWASRHSGIAWTTAGGDANGAATTSTTTGTTANVSLSWNITADVQQWFGDAAPVANYGTIIRNQAENSGSARTAIFSSNLDATEARHPQLTLEFIQNVQGLSATAGNNQIVLNWSYPAAIGSIVSATNGVVIVRQAGGVVAGTVVPADGTTYLRNAGCANNIGGASIVFVSSSLPTKFDDSASGDNPVCPPVNGTLYAYKVFTKDAATNYSISGPVSQYTPYVAAMPNTTASTQVSTQWIAPSGATALMAPGILPSTVAVVAANSNIAFGVKPTDGTSVFAQVATDGSATGRPPVLDIPDSSIGTGVSYIADDDGFVYALNTANGNTLWMTNPTNSTANAFIGGAGVFVKKFAGAAYTRTTDLVVVGTRNAGTTTANQIIGLDGNNGSVAWTVTGNAGGAPNMDIVSSTPLIDYVNSVVWVASQSNGSTAANRPSLWKINPNASGTRVLATASLNDISGAPSLTVKGDVLFVGNDSGTIYAVSTAINTTGAAPLASFAAGDTRVVGEPLVLGNSAPYTVIFSGATRVREVIFNGTAFVTAGAGTFNIAMPGGCTPSSPIGFAGLGKVYVGCSDGTIYQIDLASGAIDASKTVRPGATMGDPTLDTEQNLLIVGCTNSRVYAIKYPF